MNNKIKHLDYGLRYKGYFVDLFLRNKISNLKSQISNPRGFTIVEFLLYMGLLAILLSAMTAIFGAILDASTETKATASVDEDGKFIMARITHDVQSATSSAAPSLGQTGTTLQLLGTSANYTYTYDAVNGNLNLLNTTAGTTDMLNGSDASVSAFTVQRIGNGGNTDTILTKFTLTSRVIRTGGVLEQRSFETLIGL